MKRNLSITIITLCVLTVMLTIAIIIYSRNAIKPVPLDSNDIKVGGIVTPTEMPEPANVSEPTSDLQISSATEGTPFPKATRTEEISPTPDASSSIDVSQPPDVSKTPEVSQAPEISVAPDLSIPEITPTKEASPTPEVTQVSPTTESSIIPPPTETTTIPTPEATDEITDAPQSPDGNGETIEPEPGSTSGTETPPDYDSFISLYSHQSEEYTLIADSVSGSWLFLKNSDNSIRQTEFKYAPEYEEVGRFDFEPVLGYQNDTFFFMADNQLIASNGETETIVYTSDDAYARGYETLNGFAQSENRFMANLNGTMVVVDSRTLAVETYTHEHSIDFFALTDEALYFSDHKRIQAGPYFNILYIASEGSVNQLGMIGEITEHYIAGDTITIKSGDELFEINTSTQNLIAPQDLEPEYTLHLPVYSSGYVSGLSEIRYINYNTGDKPVQSIKLPGSWEAKCYYFTYYPIPYFYSFHDKENSHLLPGESGEFLVVDPSAYPLEESKYLDKSSVKEKLFSGKTLLGEGEIFLLERNETYYNKSTEVFEEVPFEIIYTWIPIKEQSQAYQFYIYVPRGQAYQDYLNMMKQFIEAE